ncbi:putative transcription factor MYB family [Helianthus annuus]|uniref:Transcription factor MYB family n=1 Tax=Helianthus annuus TaxID=4232 RepID=A0A9K3IX47_HELAN|nr:putative transcription factor MYB family [Helianthus annuus]
MSHSDSGSDSDTGIEQDMEALKRAFSVTGAGSDADFDVSDEFEDEEDMELLRNIQKRFSVSIGTEHDEASSTKPLQTILPSVLSDENDDSDDDFETLRAIQRRFSQYDDSTNICAESSVQRPEQVGATNNIDLGNEPSPNFFVKRINNGQGFSDCVDGRATNQQNSDISSNITPDTPYANVSEGHEPGSELVDGGFPRSAQAFVEAIKKNRVCQKLIRNKVAQIEARMEENRKLRERVKILKDFQTACRKKTGRALSQKKDARIQLISVFKQRGNASKVKDKNALAIYQGPAENSHVARYKDAVSKYPFSLTREPWSKEEKENLLKGIRQQFQKMLMDNVNLLSGGDADPSCWVNMVAQIKDHKITHEEIKSFLKDVRWKDLASIWRNCEDPLINHGPWTTNEDKKLLLIVSNRGISNWIEIASELNTNRTPFQCLSRFQRSLNASIIKNEWTPSEDEELRKAVAEYGETNWQLVASTLEGRTGTQCSNRWKKSLNPQRERVGKWDPYEDKCLKVVVSLFGAKNWNKIAKFVPGRTQVQCRERWVNCLDPCLNMDEWTGEEDMKLKEAIEEHQYCWSRIAGAVPPRTDSQCRRRWKVLLPHEVGMLQVARSMKKAAFISNFVDREEERPDLSVKDFVAPLQIESDPKANEGSIISYEKKQRTVLKKRSRRARKVSRTDKVDFIDEDDVAENNGHVDITINGVEPASFDKDNSKTKKKATGKRKGNEKGGVFKIRSRRARQVTHTEKVLLRLMDEDDDGHAGITGYNVEENRTFDVNDDCEIETRKRKWNQRDDDMAKEKIKAGRDCEVERSFEEELKVYVRRRFRKHSDERCNTKTDEEELEDEETLGSFLIKLKKIMRER